MEDNIKQERINNILNNFIDNPEFYDTKDFKAIKDIIADKYYNDLKIIDKISKSKEGRKLLGSSKLLMTILGNLNNKNFQFNDDNVINDFFLLINIFLLYEESFFSKKVLLESIDFLVYLIEIIDTDIVKKGRAEEKKIELENLFSFFKKVIGKIELVQTEQTKFKILFDRIKIVFQYNNYSHQETWLKFYLFYYSNQKEIPAVKTEVINVINTFIQNSTDPKRLRKTISMSIEVRNLMKLDNHFSNTIFSLCRNKLQFAIEFYYDFDSQKRQSLIEFYVPTNNNKSILNLNDFLKGIEYDIPNKLSFANKILIYVRNLTTINEIKLSYETLINLKLDESEMNSTNFELQMTQLILNTNIEFLKVGVHLYNKSKKYFDIKKLKDEAVTFLLSRITNLNSYHFHFSRLLNLKIALNKVEFSNKIKGTESNLNYIKQYVVSSGNVIFYNAIISKFTEELILEINNHIISNIPKNQKYKDIITEISNNKKFLKVQLYERLKDLAS